MIGGGAGGGGAGAGGGMGGGAGGGMGGAGWGQMLQMISMIMEGAAKGGARQGYAHGAGGEETNKYAEISKTAQEFGDPISAGISGYLAGKKDKKIKKKIKKRIEAQRATTRNIYEKGISQQEASQRLATKQALGGFDTAKSAAQLSASSAKRSTLEREQQTAGKLSQHLTNRGLSGTSVGANLNRGVAADTSRNLAGIDEELGQYFGQLAMGRAAVESGGTMALSGIANERTNFNISDANFWSGYDWNKLGQHEAKMYGGGGVQFQGQSIPSRMFGGGQ